MATDPNAIVTLAKNSPEATAVLVMAMENNARHLDWVEEQVRSGLERERDELQEEVLMLRAELAAIRNGFHNLLYP